MTVIFGGTGSLGKALVKRIYGLGDNIHIVSRCEERQAAMKKLFPNCIYHLGDVTNPFSLPYISNPGHVFNLAAMKHVDLGESNFEYCSNVNFQGVVNTYSWAFEHGAESYTQSSTDKACKPVNVYGMAKAMGEKYLFSRRKKFPVSVCRWSNVLNSRGSVVGKFSETLLAEKKVYITDLAMTRFWVNLTDVADFMWNNRGTTGLNIPPMKAAKLTSLANALAIYHGIDSYGIEVIGIRPGERIHEDMTEDMNSGSYEEYSMSELVHLVERCFND